MRAEYYTLWGDELRVYNNLPQILIAHPHDQPPLEVAIGIDPSTTTTGFCIGRMDSDCPFIGMQFVREESDSPFTFITEMMDYIVYNIIAVNNIVVKFIFTEDKYEQTNKYSRHTDELLSTVKTGVNSLPNRIKYLGVGRQTTAPKLILMNPPTWRKSYLGDLNTSAKRHKIKDIVVQFTIQKYNYHPNNRFQVDMMESIGIYSAGFIKHVEPNLKDGTHAKVDFNNMNWSHKIKIYKDVLYMNEETLKDVVNKDPVMRQRKEKYGMKAFEYIKGNSLEKNIRGLTSKSNAVFITVLDTWDLEALPIYYEMKIVPRDGQKLLIMAYREHESKGGLQ